MAGRGTRCVAKPPFDSPKRTLPDAVSTIPAVKGSQIIAERGIEPSDEGVDPAAGAAPRHCGYAAGGASDWRSGRARAKASSPAQALSMRRSRA